MDAAVFREMMRTMPRSTWRATVLAAMLLSAGCAELGLAPHSPPPASPETVLVSVLETLRADDAGQRRGLAEARIAQRVHPGDDAPRARLGLLLALLPAPLADSAQAETLLAPLAAASDGPWAGLASIALAGVVERRRIEARARHAEARAVNAERGSARAEERARQAAVRAADAERKLEAMKAIERRVLEREVQRNRRRR
jgi:hypothetical protein